MPLLFLQHRDSRKPGGASGIPFEDLRPAQPSHDTARPGASGFKLTEGRENGGAQKITSYPASGIADNIHKKMRAEKSSCGIALRSTLRNA